MDSIHLLFNKLNVKWTIPWRKGFLKLDNGNRVEIKLSNSITDTQYYSLTIWFPTGNICSHPSFSIDRGNGLSASYNFEKMEFHHAVEKPQVLSFIESITNFLDTWSEEEKYSLWMPEFEKNEKYAKYGVQ